MNDCREGNLSNCEKKPRKIVHYVKVLHVDVGLPNIW